MEEIVPIKVQLNNLKGNNLKLYVLSDMHIGDSNADIPTLKRIIQFIKDTPECYCILLGDILNTALKNSKSDIYNETLNIMDAQKLALELLSPIKDKIIAMTPGNHENRVWREVGVDLSLWLAEKLGLQDRYRVNGMALTIQFGKDINKDLTNYLTIKFQNSSMDTIDTISNDTPETYTITYTIDYKGYTNSISNKIVIRE